MGALRVYWGPAASLVVIAFSRVTNAGTIIGKEAGRLAVGLDENFESFEIRDSQCF